MERGVCPKAGDGVSMTAAQQKIAFALGFLALISWFGTGATAAFQVWKHWDFLSTTVTPEAARNLADWQKDVEYRLARCEER